MSASHNNWIFLEYANIGAIFWATVMVHNLDCINVLDEFLRSFNLPNIDIKVKILYLSCPDKKMLPWQELLRDKRYFPIGDEPSNEELITFLTTPTLLNGVALKGIIEIVLVLKQQWKLEITVGAVHMVVNTKDVNSLVTNMCALRCSLPGWDAYSAILIDRMKALKDRGRSPQDGLHLIQVIMDMLKALRASNSLYDKLTPHTLLTLSKDFSGTRHCEACLCSLECKNLCTEPHAKVAWLREKLRVCPSSFIP